MKEYWKCNNCKSRFPEPILDKYKLKAKFVKDTKLFDKEEYAKRIKMLDKKISESGDAEEIQKELVRVGIFEEYPKPVFKCPNCHSSNVDLMRICEDTQ